MAQIKITALPAYADPASTDVLPIVDVGADVTKKVSIANLLKNASAGTAAAPGIAFGSRASLVTKKSLKSKPPFRHSPTKAACVPWS